MQCEGEKERTTEKDERHLFHSCALSLSRHSAFLAQVERRRVAQEGWLVEMDCSAKWLQGGKWMTSHTIMS